MRWCFGESCLSGYIYPRPRPDPACKATQPTLLLAAIHIVQAFLSLPLLSLSPYMAISLQNTRYEKTVSTSLHFFWEEICTESDTITLILCSATCLKPDNRTAFRCRSPESAWIVAVQPRSVPSIVNSGNVVLLLVAKKNFFFRHS